MTLGKVELSQVADEAIWAVCFISSSLRVQPPAGPGVVHRQFLRWTSPVTVRPERRQLPSYIYRGLTTIEAEWCGMWYRNIGCAKEPQPNIISMYLHVASNCDVNNKPYTHIYIYSYIYIHIYIYVYIQIIWYQLDILFVLCDFVLFECQYTWPESILDVRQAAATGLRPWPATRILTTCWPMQAYEALASFEKGLDLAWENMLLVGYFRSGYNSSILVC